MLNCTVVSNEGGGIRVLSTLTNVIENTISYFNCPPYSNFYFSGSGVAIVSNCCTTPLSVLPAGTSGLNIKSDPQFVNKDAGDWRLKADSPCVNSGMNQDWMTNAVDLDGRTRIRYGTVDMGAYERINSGTIYTLR
jgi:hypothetical protein